MRTLLMLVLVLSTGCFRDLAESTTDQRQPTPAEKAQEVIATAQQALQQQDATTRQALVTAGPLFAAGDPATRAAVHIVQELRARLASEPAFQLTDELASTAPSIAARTQRLRTALDAHSQLLQALHVSPLPPAANLDTGAHLPEGFAEAAIQVEDAINGRWPLKRAFIAYALELEAIRDEAEALAQCTEACPPGVADQAAALQAAASHLVAQLEAFAALHC